MTILERFNKIKETDKENLDALFELFEEDSKSKSALIDHFYPFFQIVFSKEGYKRIKLINDIAKKYYNNNPHYENLYQLIYLQMNYAYSIGDYSQAIHFISKFDKKTTPSDFLIGAYCNQLNILTSLKMEKEAYECIKEISEAEYFQNGNHYSKCVFYLNAVPLTVKGKDVEKTYKYLRLLEESLKEQNFLGDEKELVIKVINFYAKIFLTKHELIEGDIQTLAIEFYDFVMSKNMYTQTLTFDTNTFITILDSILAYCSDKMLYDICEKIILDTNPVNRDLVDFYNFLYKTENAFYVKNEKLKHKHLKVLHDFYNESIYNNVQSLRDSLSLQLLEQRYSALETKYNLDVLTNCFNRNYLLELESNVISNACVCYIDLDKLKQVNDNFGHVYGDIFLKSFSKILHKSFNLVHNQIFRYGGDEFVVIVYNEDKESVIRCLNYLFENSKNTKMDEIKLESISFSCGVCFLNEEMFLKEAMVLSDKAMYACKNIRKKDPECRYIIYED